MIPKYPFGATGHESTRVLFGAAAFWDVTQDAADRTLDVLLEYGINHIDTAASYGKSELRVGPWMPRYRDQFFLATKTGERTYQKAKDEIHRSLDLLKTDHLDLLQLHNLATQEEWDVAMAPGGALEAAIEAREAGLTRFIGVTGHGTGIAAMHLKSLERFPFTSVLLPYNYMMMQNGQYAADFERLYAVCQERNVAFQTIKGITRSPWGDKPHHTTTWYEPLTEQSDIDRAVAYVLGRPGAFLNTASDPQLLPRILDAASRWDGRAPDDAEMRQAAASLEMAPLFT
ncbi:MAG: aldo/keto reductase [Anaerolineae bacterium]